MTKSYQIALLPGDGTGIEVAEQAKRTLKALGEQLGIGFEIDEIPCGGQYYLEHGKDWPDDAEARCRAADVILLGAVGWPSPDGTGPVTMTNGKMAGYSPVIGNRLNLDLYANVRPVKLFDGVKTRISGERKHVWDAKNVDMVFLRENTEGLYSGIGGVVRPGGIGQVASDTRIITRDSSERVIRMAFEIAMQRNGAPKDGQKRVTCIVKNNVLSGCRFFYEIFQEIGKDYPEVEQDVAIIDAFTQWLIGQPEYYDVLVTTNMFGDIVTDLASVLQGGMGMAVGCNVGDDYAMFEPIHGSAPRHAGKDKVNPIAMLMSTAEGLRWLGKRKTDADLTRGGDAIERAIKELLKTGHPLTYDLVGDEKAASMTAVTDAVISRLSDYLAS
ncbi:MAG: isocitrate/isopropylmalate dehydrogenase family protein [Myxococcota bacterium]|nr:isocitrate/isopropylmalate dehydrogenase family protein [Myxococcota bacterium]